MRKIKVSICIPVYNADNYLIQCLESIVNQTFSDFEIICINDGSTDNSKEILENYKKNYNFIKVINQKNMGVIAARIRAYNEASGEYIAWVDADDFVEKNMYSKLYNTAKENNADIVYCNYNFYPHKVINKEKWFKKYDGKIDYNFISKNTIQWNKIVKKELLDKLEIQKLFNYIGEGCYAIALINAKKIVSIDECLYNYRVGQNSLSSNFKNINWYVKVVEREKNKVQYVREKKYSDYWIRAFNFKYLYYNMILMIVSAYNNDKKMYLTARNELKSKKYFSSQNKKFLQNDLEKKKMFFIKYIGMNSFYLLKIFSRIVLNNKYIH